jgi:hypothetical protein
MDTDMTKGYDLKKTSLRIPAIVNSWSARS